MTAVKFCGIRRPEDLDFINQSQPDYIGFVFAPSRRQVTASQAAALANRLKVPISTVGVFVNEPLDSLCAIAKKARIQVIQLHGEETEADIWELRKHLPHQKIWKAVRYRLPTISGWQIACLWTPCFWTALFLAAMEAAAKPLTGI